MFILRNMLKKDMTLKGYVDTKSVENVAGMLQ